MTSSNKKTKFGRFVPGLDVNIIKGDFDSDGKIATFLLVMAQFTRAGHGLFILPDQDAGNSLKFTMAVLELSERLRVPQYRREFLRDVQRAALAFQPANDNGGKSADACGAANDNTPKDGAIHD